ncbi:MAG: hypothetical protein AMXMBFR13_45680 [Phycisphaerae bacterium]
METREPHMDNMACNVTSAEPHQESRPAEFEYSSSGGDASAAGVGSAAGTAQQEALDAKDQTREALHKAGRRTREMAHQFKHEARRQAGEAMRRVQEQSQSMLAQQKDMAADHVSDFAAAIWQAAERLHEEGKDNVAGYVEDFGHRIERAADYLHDRDINGMLRDVRDLTRRRPGLFFGGMLLAGLALARFLKSSREELAEEHGFTDYEAIPPGSPHGIASPEPIPPVGGAEPMPPASGLAPATAAHGPLSPVPPV